MSSFRIEWRFWAPLGELNPGGASVLRGGESRADNVWVIFLANTQAGQELFFMGL